MTVSDHNRAVHEGLSFISTCPTCIALREEARMTPEKEAWLRAMVIHHRDKIEPFLHSIGYQLVPWFTEHEKHRMERRYVTSCSECVPIIERIHNGIWDGGRFTIEHRFDR